MATTTTPTSFGRTPPTVRSLDDLASRTNAELELLYREAPTPDGVTRLVGRPKGRALNVRGTDSTLIGGAIKAWAAAESFVWDGKTFGALSAHEGSGINRIKLLANLDWFPFRTRIETSHIDGKPCVYLDYEQPGNPFFIARVRDEIREVAPGLWLGPAMWKQKNARATLVLWFAVDFNTPSKVPA